MLSNFGRLFKIASWLTVITGILHLSTLLAPVTPKNETEEQLLSLMREYKFDLGGGIERSIHEIMTGLSAGFGIFIVFAGVLNLFLFGRGSFFQNRNIVIANIFLWTILLVIVWIFFFWPPMILTSLCWIFYLLAYLGMRSKNTKKFTG